MTRLSLPLRNLSYFASANVLIILGVAIGTATLTGALLLGDSLKGSLEQVTLDRLGLIDSALVGDHFFPAGLAERVQKARADGGAVVPVILLRGSVLRRPLNDNKLLARAGRVQVVGVDPRFWELFGQQRGPLDDGVVINQALADALQMQTSDGLEVRIEKPSSIPGDSLLGERGSDSALVIATSKLAGVIPNSGPGRFTLAPTPATPLILYVKLESLQRRISDGQQIAVGSANVLLGVRPGLQAATDEVITLEDLGFALNASADGQTQTLTTSRLLFAPRTVDAVQAACQKALYSVTPVLTYLANRVYRLDGDKTSKTFVPYSTMVGVEAINGISIGEDEVVVNEFVNDDLSPNLKHIWFDYYVESDSNKLIEQFTDLKVKGVVKMTGEAADKTWTPKFPGMKGTLAQWEPPFPKSQWHREWIRPRDEAYYKQYEATPKFFIHPKTALKLFSSKYGNATGLRIKTAFGFGPATDAAALSKVLIRALPPADYGMKWLDVKAQGLKSASSGATTGMFGGLFAGFSLFLIVSAALLVALLFRLRMERRAGEIGLLQATGWPVSLVRRTLLAEGLTLALIGALLGIPLALGYSWLVIYGLRHGWSGLLSSDSLVLHYQPLTLMIGAAISVMIALVAMWLSLRSLVKLPAPVLLSGRTEASGLTVRGPSRLMRWLPALLALAIMGLMAWGWYLPIRQQAPVFFGVGFLCLATLLIVLRNYLREQAVQGKFNVVKQGLGSFGMLNATRSPGRSLLTVTLLAAGCFLVVGVGGFRQSRVDTSDRYSSTGGFALIGETDLPLRSIPRSQRDWAELLGDRIGEVAPQLVALQSAAVFPLKLRAGDDVSCLNLYQPAKPRVLGISDRLVLRGGFIFAEHLVRDRPWNKLSGPGLPVFLDDHTAQWVLQKQLGESMSLTDDLGTPFEARVAGMLTNSIFQSEILLSEANFHKLYPSESGYRYFLIDVPKEDVAQARAVLELAFGESHGLVVTLAADKLAAFQAVENTYIGTFQALGALGLLLGTAGLGLVILRNVQERKAELATLQAIGFSRQQLGWMIFCEVGWLVMMGLFIGSLSAFIVVLPLLSLDTALQLLIWLGVIAILVPVVAVVSSYAGLRLALNIPLIPALRGE